MSGQVARDALADAALKLVQCLTRPPRPGQARARPRSAQSAGAVEYVARSGDTHFMGRESQQPWYQPCDLPPSLA